MKEAQGSDGGETVKKQRTLDSWPKSSDSIWWYSIRPDCFVSSDLPHLSALAKRYIYTCLNSADAERSFSIYNLVFSERRRRLSEANLKALVFLYYNSFISYEYIV
ncbi:hat family dimerization domain [Plakobranchus ocellatus]|uniref:Hat family dimerization domain n=1 Tax=Plakobranchus ocellatus TaxID=259542 RepID=A0AAV4E0Z1_9GAST|nr:hat family dimerization domain [Plakobranchus ocellatus]